MLVDKSTSYLEHPEAAGRADAVLPGCRVLVQLRDPVARAASNWAFSSAHGLEDRPLADALAAGLEATPGPGAGWDPARTSVDPRAYLERGHYARYLEPWLDVVGDRLAVLLLEDLLADPAAVATAYAHAGLDPGHRPAGLDAPVNASGPRPDLPADLERALREHYAGSDRALAALLDRPLPWPTGVGAA